jgi:transglutaminase-like putative cysteine protease
VHLHYTVQEATDIILQIVVPSFADQSVISEEIVFGETLHNTAVSAEEQFGERKILRVETEFLCDYTALVRLDRPILDVALLSQVPAHRLPSDAIRYLMPSRYCQSDEFQSFVNVEFGNSSGGERIAQIRDWVFDRFQYVSGHSNAQTTALDSFVQHQGVCRDFAHVLIALARASSIPARFVSAYAPFVSPQDFHAVAEVYLEGSWHLVDATGMAASNQIARVGVGLDAAEVSFMSSFGPVLFQNQSVQVDIVE